MATPSSILAWRIPGMEGPGGLSSTGLHRVRHDWSDLAAAAANGKEPNCNEGDLGSIPGLRRSPGEGHGNPLQYSCLDNPQGQRGLVGYSPWGHRVRHDWATKHSAAIELSTASSGGPTVTPAHSDRQLCPAERIVQISQIMMHLPLPTKFSNLNTFLYFLTLNYLKIL